MEQIHLLSANASNGANKQTTAEENQIIRIDASKAAVLRSETVQQVEKKRNEQLKAIGKDRLQKLIPADTKAVIVAELHEDESDVMTDYFSYRTIRTVILGFSPNTKDLFSEMRKYAANFEETAFLTEENRKYEHREKYTGGAGYYLGESNYSGWIIRKEKYFKNRDCIINAFALLAADESNICVKQQEEIPCDFLIVDYSEKALAVFGDTKAVKDKLKALGGRFNPNLTHKGEKKKGWVFSKSREESLRNLLTVK
jgi:hypothetical protein